MKTRIFSQSFFPNLFFKFYREEKITFIRQTLIPVELITGRNQLATKNLSSTAPSITQNSRWRNGSCCMRRLNLRPSNLSLLRRSRETLAKREIEHNLCQTRLTLVLPSPDADAREKQPFWISVSS